MPIPGEMLDPNRRNPTSGFSDRVVKGFVDGKIPLFNGSAQPVGGNLVNKFLDDPTYLGFSIFFDFQNSPLLFVSDDSALEGDYAYKYLSSVSPLRAKLLKTFVESLQYLQNNKPYVFQTIEGLDRCWNIATDLTDTYMGGDDAKIGIGCLESLDMRITGIMDMYRKIAYDNNSRKEILPANLRKFRCTIFVQEIRRFKTLTAIIRQQQSETSSNFGVNGFVSPSTAGGLLDAATLNRVASGEENDPIALFVNDNVSTVSFNLEFCEFTPETSSVVFSSFNNAGEKTPAQQKIGFKYEKVYEVNRYSSIDSEINDNSLSRADRLRLGPQESALEAASRRVLASLAGAVKSRVGDGLVNVARQIGIKNPLGTLNTVTTLLSADGVVRFGESLVTQAGERLINTIGRNLGVTNVYAGQDANVNEQLQKQKIFEDIPDPNPLNPYRVYSAPGGPTGVLEEKLDPLSSLTMPSSAYQPTNFNGTNPPTLGQEKVFQPSIPLGNFASTNILGVGSQPGPFQTIDIIPPGDPEPILQAQKIIPAGERERPLASQKILPTGQVQQPLQTQRIFSPNNPEKPLASQRIMPQVDVNEQLQSQKIMSTGNVEQSLSSQNIMPAGQLQQPLNPQRIFSESTIEENMNPERIMPAAYTPTNNDGSLPPTLKSFNIMGAGGPPGPSLLSENILK
jgi:hypothetical protein